MRDVLVICTRNRPDDVARVLASVAEQRRPPTTVLVMDGSDAPSATAPVVESFRARTPALDVRYEHLDPPGLTRQRNAAVAATDHEVVHFVDDDTVLDPGYLEEIMGCFEDDRNATIGGVGGGVVNEPKQPERPLRRLFLLDARRPGAVLRSGNNTTIGVQPAPIDVDWLQGCSCSYRREVFGDHRFDESLSGYAMGEDLDFSYRVRQRWRLVTQPTARIQHLSSPVSRLSEAEVIRMEVVNRRHRVRSGIGRYSMIAYWWSVLGQALLFAARGAVERSPRYLGLARATLAGARDPDVTHGRR